MRLFLASSRPAPGSRDLADLVAPGARAAVVANAVDNLPDFPRAEWVDEERRMLARVGLSAFELDLRGYYQRPAALASALAQVDLVWITGGNAFVLRDALRRSHLDRLLTDRVTDGSLAYGGCSAGACVSGPTLRGLELVDDVSAVACPVWDGLGLVDFCIAPHHRSAHPENRAIQHVVEYFLATGLPYRALRDGQAIVVRDATCRIVDT
jgi:dipeptidase E